VAAVGENGFCDTRLWEGILWQQILRWILWCQTVGMNFVVADCEKAFCPVCSLE
jgi:hypothetical protein